MTLLRPIGQPMTQPPLPVVQRFKVRGLTVLAVIDGTAYALRTGTRYQMINGEFKPVKLPHMIDWELAGLYADHVMPTPAYQAWIAEQREIDRHRPDPYAFLTEQDNCLSISDRH